MKMRQLSIVILITIGVLSFLLLGGNSPHASKQHKDQAASVRQSNRNPLTVSSKQNSPKEKTTDQIIKERSALILKDDVCAIAALQNREQGVDTSLSNQIFFNSKEDIERISDQDWNFLKDFYLNFNKTGKIPSYFPSELSESMRTLKAADIGHLFYENRKGTRPNYTKSASLFEKLAEEYPDNGLHKLALHHLYLKLGRQKEDIDKAAQEVFSAPDYRLPSLEVWKYTQRHAIVSPARIFYRPKIIGVDMTSLLKLLAFGDKDTDKEKKGEEILALAKKFQGFVKTSSNIDYIRTHDLYIYGYYLKIWGNKLLGKERDKSLDPLAGGTLPLPTLFEAESDELSERWKHLDKNDKEAVSRYEDDREDLDLRIKKYLTELAKDRGHTTPFEDLLKTECDRTALDEYFYKEREYLDEKVDLTSKGVIDRMRIESSK